MRAVQRTRRFAAWGLAGSALLLLVLPPGCGSGGTGWEFYNPYYSGSSSGGGTTPGGSTGGGGGLAGSDRDHVDPCTEALTRKYVTISMRNLSSDYIHYFMIAIAFVDVDQEAEDAVIPTFDFNEYPDGAVCADDIALYTQRGYTLVDAGESIPLGDYCITGPALYYYHRNGNFRVAAGTDDSGLGSAIAPSQGTAPTYDNFFTSAGVQLPVPDFILFHNPGTGEGASLKISESILDPCAIIISTDAPPACQRDSFYYTGPDDIMAGSRALGTGSGRRVPGEIQGTACECRGLQFPMHSLAPSGVTAAGSRCDEFFRGGRIEYVFVRDDTSPPYPQLLWRVTDGSGGLAHDFDSSLSGG